MKHRKKSLLFLVFALVLSVILAACASEPDESGSTNDQGDAGSGDGTGGDLVIANASDIVSLDPAGSNDQQSTNVQTNIYETLITQDENMELQPGLAESWEQVDDTTWEFKLREGVTFHDGSEFNAEVVKANIERILDPEVASQRAFLYEMVTDIEVVDDYTVRFTTEYPFSPLPAHLAHDGGSMVSLEVIEEDYAAMEEGEEPGSVINENPVGTGYFKFEEWQPGQHVRLVKNEDYWGEPAKLDSVTFKVVGEDLTRVAELETGDSHISNPLSPSDVAQVEATDGMHVQQQGGVALSYLGFNMQKEPFDNQQVRQAISMAINKEEILEGIYDGTGQIAEGPLPPNVFGYDENVSGIEYDPEQAQELLAEAGYEDGFSTTIWTSDQRENIDVATNVQAQLSEVGIEAEVEILEWGAYLEQTSDGGHDMFVLAWSTVTGDADYGLYALFHSEMQGAPGNRSFLDNPEVDELLEQGRQESDPEQRQEIYTELQELLVDIAPMVYLRNQDFLLGVRDEVKGLTQLPTGTLELHEVYLEQ